MFHVICVSERVWFAVCNACTHAINMHKIKWWLKMWKWTQIENKTRTIFDINYYIAEKLTKWTCHNEALAYAKKKTLTNTYNERITCQYKLVIVLQHFRLVSRLGYKLCTYYKIIVWTRHWDIALIELHGEKKRGRMLARP